MKKISALLHDVTVINFLLVAKLTLRYRKASALAICSVFVSVFYLYFTQVTIYSKKVYFKVNASEEASSKNSIMDMMGGTNSSLVMGYNEIKLILTDYEFTRVVAEKILDSSSFMKLDFNSPTQKEFKAHADFFEHCPDRDCRVKVVQSILPKLYSFEAEAGTDRFALNATTRSAVTTLVLMNSLKTSLEEVRYKKIVTDLEEEIKQTQDMISKSRLEIEEKGGFARVASSESMEALISQQHEKIRGITQSLNREIDLYQFQQIRLKESGVTAGKDVGDHNKLDYERYVKMNKNIEGLRQNIASINSTPASRRSSTDEQVLAKLKDELLKSENELKRMGRVKRNVAFEDQFINSQINNQSNFEFDYNVSKAKLTKRRTELEDAKKELDSLFGKKAELENGLLALRPDLEYLKQMESKFVALKMLKSAAKADVVFDKFGPEVASFKRNTLLQFIIFSLLIVGFALFIGLIVIYIFDDRIYDEYEVMKCCDNLQVLGEAPSFDQ